MLQVEQGSHRRNCQGLSRRTALKAGFLGLGGMSLADVMRLRAEGAAQRRDTAVILLWLDGGPSQLETYDPKPEAPVEYRGPWTAIDTNVPGIRISESLPNHARHADKMVLVRSLHHDNGDHFAGAHWMLTGRYGSTSVNLPQKYPSVGSITARMRGANRPGLPPYVGLPAAQSVYLFPGYQGAAYLGPAYNPFDVDTQQKYLAANSKLEINRPRCLESFAQAQAGRIEGRLNLLENFDKLRRDLDQTGGMAALDRYQQRAVELILGGKAEAAFDLTKEDPRIADRYGSSPWGRYTLMARRLVEAGVTFVTVDMPHWDDHSNIEKGHGYKLGPLDQAVGALLDDLSERQLLDKVLVVVMGEFGRTPRINSGQPGIPIPGRDHWGAAISVMLAGGGLRTGQVVGATNAKAEHPVERPLTPDDLLATVYHVLGIDPSIAFPDHAGRPVPILDIGKPISEII
ncbi:MAG TPA: DUF1501 domain-containing protein [Pirellulales bacterium]|nr:DUF1501 domain-containing protein [Pirellulales bacterium]